MASLPEKMKNFRTYDLVINVYQQFQKIKLSGPMRDQFQRAVLSIPLNLAEGSAKSTPKGGLSTEHRH